LEGYSVHNPAYREIDYRLVIAESSYLEQYSAGPERSEWTEEEIAAVRAVLHKLSAIRVLNPTDAEDLVQETILTMLTKYPANDLEKGLLVWSMGILRKKVGNYYRRTQRFTSFNEQESHAQQSVRELIVAASPESSVLHDELQRIIGRSLAQLPSPQRQVIELLIAGFDSGEVVKQLHPERYQNVINHIYRGRQKLAKQLAKYGYGPHAKAGMRSMRKCRPRK
jgi:RNA polymerase sigma factor (sigma-70 family)